MSSSPVSSGLALLLAVTTFAAIECGSDLLSC